MPPAPRSPDANGGQGNTCGDELLDRDAADERGRERCEEAEAEQRQGREETRRGRGEPQLPADVLEQRRQAGEDRAEIRPEQDDCDEEEDPGRVRCPVCWNSVVDIRHGHRAFEGGGQNAALAQARDARQPPGAYDVRTASTYGTGLTTARISTWT